MPRLEKLILFIDFPDREKYEKMIYSKVAHLLYLTEIKIM